ncbi:hypothetical protein [Pseudomonas savastanoi]|uniref:hypothetical protein n=1 Tax=Pseudomonas savastanoi TaxID=29438 RepID=UPI000E32A303|nr:hypothetical protein [Pseudomonas savastanoi]
MVAIGRLPEIFEISQPTDALIVGAEKLHIDVSHLLEQVQTFQERHMTMTYHVRLIETKLRTMVIEVEADDEESAIAAALVESKTTGDAEWDLENEPINVDAAVVDGE